MKTKSKTVKLLLCVMAILMTVSVVMFSFTAFADEPEIVIETSGKCGANLDWSLDGDKLTVSGIGAMNNYSIDSPSPFKGLNIKSIVINMGVSTIGSYAFENCAGVTEIKLPDSITSIGNRAFTGCSGLNTVETGNGLSSISGFDHSGIKKIVLGTGFKEIADGTFQGFKDLETIVIPSSVTKIGENAFLGCASLKSVTIPASVKSIGNGAFKSCLALTDIALPASVEAIPEGAFEGCVLLKSFSAPGAKTIGKNAFSLCSSLESVIIPDTVTSIGDQAFNGCLSIKTLKLGSKVESIGNAAFFNCENIGALVIPDSVKAIGTKAFGGCNKLVSLSTGNGITSLAAFDLAGNKDLTDVVIGNGITIIDANTFNKCTSLEKVTIGSKVTSIGSSAFYGCAKLASVKIPDSVILIGDSSFRDCANLETVTFGSKVSKIGNNAFYGCKKLKELKLPDSIVPPMGTNAFGNCPGLEKIETGNGIGDFTGFTLADCPKLKTIVLGNGFTAIRKEEFKNCKALENINIGSKITSIGERAFAGCIKLSSITLPDTVVSLGKSVFRDCSGLKYAKIGSQIKDVPAYTFYQCMALENVEFSSGATSIGEYAFYFCGLLKSVTLPNTLTSIGDYAFYECSSLPSINIPDSVMSVGKYSFKSCIGLKDIHITASISKIPDSMFWGCTGIENIVIPEGITEIEDSGFYGCSSLKEINIPGNVKKIGKYAFYACSSVPELVIPKSVESIGDQSFYGCSKLLKITVLNPNCKLPKLSLPIWDKEVIYGYAGSTAQAFVNECGNTMVTFVDLDGGDHVHAYVESVVEPTCINPGKKIYTCNVQIKTADGVYAVYEKLDGETVTATYYVKDEAVYTYDESTGVYAPAEGVALSDLTAKLCGASYEDPIPPTGHDFNPQNDKFVEATCTRSGYVIHTCSRCGETYNDTFTDPVPHSYVDVSRKATMTADGGSFRECIYCGERESEETVIAKIKSVKLSYTSYTYTGAERNPTVTVIDDNGIILSKKTDYTVKKAEGRTEIGTYSYIVTFEGDYEGSTVVSFTIKPAAATGLKAATASTSSSKLSWKKVKGATGYRIYLYNSKEKSYTKVADTEKTTYTVTGIKATSTYMYAVKAYTKTQASGTIWSAKYSDTVTTTAKPKAPAVTVMSTSTSSVKLSWSTVKGATGYVVYMATSKTGTYKKVTTTAKTDYTVKNLNPGTKYYFKVKAYKKFDGKTAYSANSVCKSATTKIATPSVTLKASKTHGKAKVSCTKVKGATGYIIYVSSSKTGKYKKLASTTKTSYTASGLKTGTKYFKVRAYKKLGDKTIYSGYSAVKKVKVK